MSIKTINAKYKKLHDDLTKAFYAKKHSKASVTAQEQAAFDTAHAGIWADLETELRAGGYLPEPAPDPKIAYAAAKNEVEKLDIIAQKLGLK